MAYPGFRGSGPTRPPDTKTIFGNFSQSSSSPQFPSPNNSPPSQQRSPRFGTQSGYLFGNGVSEAPQQVRSPPSAVSSYPSEEIMRPRQPSPEWGSRPKFFPDDPNLQSFRPSPAVSYPASRNAENGTYARQENSQGPKRTRTPSPNKAIFLEVSPQVAAGRPGTHDNLLVERQANSQGPKGTRSPSPNNAIFFEDSPQVSAGRLGTHANLLARNGTPATSQRIWTPSIASDSSHSLQDFGHSSVEAQRSPIAVAKFQVSKGTRSPPLPFTNEVSQTDFYSPQNDYVRPAESPPILGNKSNFVGHNSKPQAQQRSSTFANITEHAGTKRVNSQVPKRMRSPSLASADDVVLGNTYSNQDNTDRETQAKAKRLARFKVELTEPEQSSQDVSKHKVVGNKHNPTSGERRKFVDERSGEAVGDLMASDYEEMESSSVIMGSCPDMCPRSEREERERKGDLDKYERLDGDRNLTTTSLAVKKYNRTAEREVYLIRPLPILQKTVSYLLDLLDQPYDDRFLGLYNFLWDRMRAVRMDLRMQHIFNQDAITMLEQMIRLHIIAMHELCEYTKGEGFSEGFDAHLNIEQMNKTSVELFQMYDDHRKRGITVQSEKEFRGYYALLKLDKHPGYKVEPAELSLDLAKMTPEIRQTREILFARDVARACRTGNFIAFFRLARKATYLQACLMHAHFAKLRTQALAALHSGLQNNQGIPIGQVTKWLAMEGEDIECLLEYHGFMIKEFEEAYMVKEGLFLNSDKDYPTKCSQLVVLKKSETIVEDVSSDQLVWPAKEVKQVVPDRKGKHGPESVVLFKEKTTAVDDDMLQFKEESTPIGRSQVQSVLNTPSPTDQSVSVSSDHQVSKASFISWSSPPSPHFAHPLPTMPEKMQTQEILPNDSVENSEGFHLNGSHLQTAAIDLPFVRHQVLYVDSLVENSAPQRAAIKAPDSVEAMIVPHEVENKESVLACQDVEEVDMIQRENEAAMAEMAQREIEVATAKLKLILRMWKRRSSKQKELREQRKLASSAALSSLSLGPPIRQNRTKPSHVCELNIDRVLSARHERHQRSWSRLNASEVVANILTERNPDAKCLSWKLLVCSQMKGMGQTNHLAGSWLLSKLMGISEEYDDELAVSSPGLSIWKRWDTNGFGSAPICCLSVIRDTEVDELDDSVAGASAVLFLVSESLPWEVQKTTLSKLLMSLPSGSRLPLLILSDMYEVHCSSSTIISELGLHYMDKTRISSISVTYLHGNHSPEHMNGFYSNDCLVEGLQWLASQSPRQSVLYSMKTRDLVIGHFNYSLQMLEKMNASLVGPNLCIKAFNAALDRAVQEIASAADANPAYWPCPEIDLLDLSSDERRAVESFLPSIGWSSAATIKPILSTINSCKLPIFGDDLSWLNRGSERKEIQDQKMELEQCLIRYLIHSCQMESALATMEAGVMLQKGARLELHGEKFRIIPRWVVIFRRLSHWRLMNLTSGTSYVAYISRNLTDPSEPWDTGECPDKISLDGDEYRHSLTQPSLDEMVGVSCSLPFGREEEPEAVQSLPEAVNDNVALEITTSDQMEDAEAQHVSEHTRKFDTLSNNYLYSDDFVVGDTVKKEADRLSKLLEQCNMLQDKIDEKLSIYF